MQCPNCRSEVPPGPTCTRCNAPLESSAVAASAPFISNTAPMPEGPDSVPLSFAQQARLFFDCVPLVLFSSAVALYVTVLGDYLGRPNPWFLLFAALVILMLAYQSFQRIRDLLLGRALVTIDVLERSWRTRGNRGNFYGKFTQLGRLQLQPKVHFQSQNGRRYRVHYSPASKIVWALEPLR
jgi:hypothetical protein